jgi:hypothetical protein
VFETKLATVAVSLLRGCSNETLGSGCFIGDGGTEDSIARQHCTICFVETNCAVNSAVLGLGVTKLVLVMAAVYEDGSNGIGAHGISFFVGPCTCLSRDSLLELSVLGSESEEIIGGGN